MTFRHAAAAVVTAILLSSAALAQPVVYNGASFSGGLTSSWSNENGSPVYAPIQPDSGNPTKWTVSMSSGGWQNLAPVSGTLSAYAPVAGGGIEGNLFHVQGLIDTPTVGGLSMAIAASVGGQIYFSGVSNPTLYYGWSLDEVTTPSGGASYAHTEGVRFMGPEYQTSLANDHHQSFGTTSILAWQNGDLRPTEIGYGFAQFNINIDSAHYGQDRGPGQTTTFDYWLILSGSPITAMPLLSPVPEPSEYAMLLAGLGLLGFMRRRKIQAG